MPGDEVIEVLGRVPESPNEHEMAIWYLSDWVGRIYLDHPKSRAEVTKYIEVAKQAWRNGFIGNPACVHALLDAIRYRFGIDASTVEGHRNEGAPVDHDTDEVDANNDYEHRVEEEQDDEDEGEADSRANTSHPLTDPHQEYVATLSANADAGDVEALCGLARHFVERGQLERAMQYYKRGVATESTEAMVELAIAHTTGRGVERDIPEAIRLFKMAASRDSRVAAETLETIYSAGMYGVEVSASEAAVWGKVARGLGATPRR
jgi:TPR repeat protein